MTTETTVERSGPWLDGSKRESGRGDELEHGAWSTTISTVNRPHAVLALGLGLQATVLQGCIEKVSPRLSSKGLKIGLHHRNRGQLLRNAGVPLNPGVNLASRLNSTFPQPVSSGVTPERWFGPKGAEEESGERLETAWRTL